MRIARYMHVHTYRYILYITAQNRSTCLQKCVPRYICGTRIYCTFMQTIHVCFYVTHLHYIYSPLDMHFDTSACN